MIHPSDRRFIRSEGFIVGLSPIVTFIAVNITHRGDSAAKPSRDVFVALPLLVVFAYNCCRGGHFGIFWLIGICVLFSIDVFEQSVAICFVFCRMKLLRSLFTSKKIPYLYHSDTIIHFKEQPQDGHEGL